VALGFAVDGDDTLVTESYEVTEPISRAGWFIIGTVYGNHDRRADLRAGMEQTPHDGSPLTRAEGFHGHGRDARKRQP